MPSITINGANGQAFPVQFNTNDAFGAANVLGTAINNTIATFGVSTQVLTGPGAVTPPAGTFGELVLTNNTSTGFSSGIGTDRIVVVNGTGVPSSPTAQSVSVQGGGLSNVSVIAGSGGLFFNAGKDLAGNNATGDTVVAGDGNNLIGTDTGTGGTLFVQTGSGNDTITAFRGTNTVVAGMGVNQIGTGSSNTVIYTTGVDVITGNSIPGGGGSDTISALPGGSDFIFGLGSNIFFSSGSTVASTLIGGSGSDTVFARAGGGTFFAGTAGNSSLIGGAGSVTLVGATSGDQLFSISDGATTGSAFLVAGSGNETISAALDNRGVTAFAGNNTTIGGVRVQANTTVFGGAGNDTLVAGTGNATLVGGGGINSFTFFYNMAGGTDLINGFTAADKIRLGGYASSGGNATVAGPNGTTASIAGVASVATVGSATQLTLTDNTRITISNFTGLNSSNFG